MEEFAPLKSTILLVDDDPSCTALLKRYLESEGYEVLSAKNGQQAIDLLNQTPPDLIITDVMMPKMDGYELLQEIRQDPMTNWIPVIFLSAKSLSSDRLRGLSAGANAYIVKPFNVDELMIQVKSLLQSSQLLRQHILRQTERRIQVPTGVKLTNAELSVAKLVAQGLSNSEIAQRLYSSKRTIESHISHMLRKTGLSNRTELSRWILENGLG